MRRVLVLMAALVLAAGCSGGGLSSALGDMAAPAEPPPGAGSASSAAETEATEENPAPRVPAPLEAEWVVKDPCDAIDRTHFAELGFDGPGELHVVGGELKCSWRVVNEPLQRVSITPNPDENGLRSVYETEDRQQYFEPTEIDSYPAVFTSALDGRDRGNCKLVVGFTDDLTFDVDTFFIYQDPCAVAEHVAEAMIDTVRRDS